MTVKDFEKLNRDTIVEVYNSREIRVAKEKNVIIY